MQRLEPRTAAGRCIWSRLSLPRPVMFQRFPRSRARLRPVGQSEPRSPIRLRPPTRPPVTAPRVCQQVYRLTPLAVISGTPTASGTSTITVKATNKRKGYRHADFDHRRYSSDNHQRDFGQRYCRNRILLSDYGDQFAHQLRRNRSAFGLSGQYRNGVISGTPTAAGTSAVTLKATNAEGSVAPL